MKVLLVASEGSPFIKTGGLADVIGALPKALKACGVDVRVIMPYYKKIKEKHLANDVGYDYVQMGNDREYAGYLHAVSDGIDYYFIDNDHYFYRDNIYGFDDDGERFAFFSFAVLEALRVIDFYPDVIHCNDWQTGLIPYILKADFGWQREYQGIRTMYSIHNIQYQGIFPKGLFNRVCMPWSNSLEFHDCLNFMKTGILESNIVTTVSPTYKYEVLTPEYAYGLNDILGLRYFDFEGILNGIDTVKYNPQTDKNIFCNYDRNDVFRGKVENKKKLLEQFGLDSSCDVPVFGLVSRLVDQKGADLFMPIMDNVIRNSNAKFIFMGSGDKYYEDYFRALEGYYPDRFKCYIGYSDPVAQKIYAGSDIFVMPSKFEPCGLGQMIAMRYGTLPLVRETGGLKDSVIPYNPVTGDGDGFSFGPFDAHALEKVMFIAINTYNNGRNDFNKMVLRAMDADFSWNQSAQTYLNLYRRITGRN